MVTGDGELVDVPVTPSCIHTRFAVGACCALLVSSLIAGVGCARLYGLLGMPVPILGGGNDLQYSLRARISSGWEGTAS
jgi:hypothetical protein